MSTPHNDNKINLGVATVIGINAMIGAGIVSMPALLMGEAGPAGIISYAMSVVVALFIVISLSRLADIHPTEGWSYEYPAKLGGHLFGMISSWAYLIGVVVAMGFIVQQAGILLADTIPADTIPASPALLGSGVLAALTLLVLAGAQASSWAQYVIVIGVFIPLFATSVVCFSHFDVGVIESFMPHGVRGIFAMVPLTLYSFMGFESIVSLYPIVRNPKKNVPLACVLAILSVASLYMVFAGSVLFSIPQAFFLKGTGESLATVLSRAFPTVSYLAPLVFVGALSAILGTLHSMIWSLGELLTDVLARMKTTLIRNAIRSKIWNDRVSTVAVSAAMLVLSLTLSAMQLLEVTVLLVAISYGLSVALLLVEKHTTSLFHLKDRVAQARRAYWINKTLAIGGLLGCGFIVVSALQRLLS